jgi:hypothetical protein
VAPVPKQAEAEIKARGGAVRWRSKCIDGQLWRFAVTKRRGPRGGKVVGYKTGKGC